MRTIYRNRHFNIYSNRKGAFIIHNTNKDFKDAHTHGSNYFFYKLIIYLCLNGKVPKGKERLLKNKRFLESALRVCSNKYKKIIESYLINY